MTTTGDANAEHETRERLGICLMRLAAMKPQDLAHPAHSRLNFRSGLPYFERTLNLFHQVARTNLREVPSEYLKIVADGAQETLERQSHPELYRRRRRASGAGARGDADRSA